MRSPSKRCHPLRCFFMSDAVFYRVIEEIIEERCVNVDYSSLNHWVINYSSYLALAAKKLNVPLPPTKWRMDESYIKGKGEWVNLYRAVDKLGDAIDIMLSDRHK